MPGVSVLLRVVEPKIKGARGVGLRLLFNSMINSREKSRKFPDNSDTSFSERPYVDAE
jgi:hypothetical protein